MKKLATLFACSFLAISIFGQNTLKVGDPDWWWEPYWEDGTIEEAVFTVEPKGIYTEVGMYLTLSAQGLGFQNYDTLEIVLNFELPDGAVVHDSWLWIDDIIIKADIVDRWTAIETYENIVDRQRDPSLLYRKPNGGYQLRVYPLAGDESRKVKISWLTPTRWSAETVSTLLPLDLLRVSAGEPAKIQVVTIPDSLWQNPRLSENLLSGFQPGNDSLWGNYFFANIDWSEVTEPVIFKVDAPLQDGIFASRLDDGDGRFYQLAYLPPNLPVANTPRKIAFLFDHENANCSFGSANLFAYLKESLPNLLTESDSFNLFFTRGSHVVERLSDHWISGHPDTVHQVLDPLVNPVSDLTSLQYLFEDAFDFIAENGGSADIVLFASSNDGQYWTWEQTGLDILDAANDTAIDVTIHVCNFQDLNLYYFFDENTSSTVLRPQHSIIYEMLTAATGGQLFGMSESGGNFWESTWSALEGLTGEPAVFDLNTDLDNGFTWQRYLLKAGGQSVSANRPVLQVGRYEGDFPMQVEFSALTTAGIFSETRTLDASQFVDSDSLGRESWVGLHIAGLEGGNPSDAQIQDIIGISIGERVLSNYTAFLALEPSQGGEPCLACWEYPDDGGGVIFSTDEEGGPASLELVAMPNPMLHDATIALSWNPDFGTEEIVFEIYDIHGRLVCSMAALAASGGTSVSVEWNGKGQEGQPVPAGVYFVVAKTSRGMAHCKLLKVN